MVCFVVCFIGVVVYVVGVVCLVCVGGSWGGVCVVRLWFVLVCWLFCGVVRCS